MGHTRELGVSRAFDLGVGGDVTAYSFSSSLAGTYGDFPVSVRAYVRIRPPLMAT